MSNNNLLIILGATLLGLLILVSSSVYAFAQQEEEEEDKDKDDDKKEKDSKDKDEEEDKDDKDESKSNDEDSEEQPPATQPQQNITEVINTTTTTTAAIQPTPTPLPEAPILEAPPTEEFNATCKCMTTSSSSTPKPIPSSNNDTQQEQQIPISNVNIKDSRSFGEVTDPAYTDFYTVPNLLDNTIDDVSFWSQAGPASGFYIKLDSTLDNYQVCSMELNVHNPKSNAPYLLDIGISKNYSGVIDQTTEIIQFDSCVKNMDEILMTFDNPSNGFISIAEMKLFGGSSSSTAASTNNIAEAAPTTIAAANKINIENSEAEIDIKNSTVTFKFDPLTATFVSTVGK